MKKVTRNLLAAIALGAVVLAGCSSSGGTLETVGPTEASTILNSGVQEVILDIRTPDEFDQGIIKGAVNIDFYEQDFADQLDNLDKDAHYVVYCRSDNRSGQAMDTFADLGFANVTEIDGGIVAWYEAGLPVVLP